MISLRLRALQKKLDKSAFNLFFEILWHILFPRQLKVTAYLAWAAALAQTVVQLAGNCFKAVKCFSHQL